MRNYKTLNFFYDYNKPTYINKIATLSMLTLILLNLSINIIKLKKLESEMINHKSDSVVNDEVEYKQEKSIDLNQIEYMYSLFGASNINEMIILNDDVQIQGKCTDLNILYDIKNMDIVKKSSVNNIKKEGDYYMFTLKYQTR
ncbi:hypothetical protein [Romboutsia sp.]|uniref:hypothetical protein n=1 Tax=Romboutsia sp. TaxID=1965302 RepID=UPI002B76182A|nr:hypothetical protein [Romboutsia sp.]HSQ88772.1 hypothetical protein [Romboutsia sp.]